jgi:hydrogenase 3 maturation protease
LANPNLKSILKGRVTILGFGNRLWRDDGAGSVLAERLAVANPEAAIFDGGMAPENYLEKVVFEKPDMILMIDATDFGGEPGEARLFLGDGLAFTGVSTHAGSPHMLAAYLEARTGAVVKLLAIQPGDSSEGGGLSPEVEATMALLMVELEGHLVAK